MMPESRCCLALRASGSACLLGERAQQRRVVGSGSLLRAERRSDPFERPPRREA